MNIVALAGGVGGAKMAHGLYQVLQPYGLRVIVNTGDDFIYAGLNICPDLDTICYTLAGLANHETGWGLEGDTFNTIQFLREMGGPDWFKIGDRDLATHLVRTHRLACGDRLSTITEDFCARWGVLAHVFPMSDDKVQTKVKTLEQGWLNFQEYFVHQNCQPQVQAFDFDGSNQAIPAPGVIDAIQSSDLVIICPSNPWVSIDPILSLREIKKQLAEKIVIAISPLIGGRAVKGPLAKMFMELGMTPSNLSVAKHYMGLIRGFVMDEADRNDKDEIEAFGIITKTTDIMMRDDKDRRHLAEYVLDFGASLSAYL